MERRGLRQDLSEARIQPTGKTRSTYNSTTSACQAQDVPSQLS